MGTISDLAQDIFRDTEDSDDPLSPLHNPEKERIRDELFPAIEEGGSFIDPATFLIQRWNGSAYMPVAGSLAAAGTEANALVMVAAAAAAGVPWACDGDLTLTASRDLSAAPMIAAGGLITLGAYNLNCRVLNSGYSGQIFNCNGAGLPLMPLQQNEIQSAWFGVPSDGILLSDAAMTAASNHVTSASGDFTGRDGQPIFVNGAGTNTYGIHGFIKNGTAGACDIVSSAGGSTPVNAVTSVSAASRDARCSFGTDAFAPFVAAIRAAAATAAIAAAIGAPKTVLHGPGGTVILAGFVPGAFDPALKIPSGVSYRGAGTHHVFQGGNAIGQFFIVGPHSGDQTYMGAEILGGIYDANFQTNDNAIAISNLDPTTGLPVGGAALGRDIIVGGVTCMNARSGGSNIPDPRLLSTIPTGGKAITIQDGILGIWVRASVYNCTVALDVAGTTHANSSVGHCDIDIAAHDCTHIGLHLLGNSPDVPGAVFSCASAAIRLRCWNVGAGTLDAAVWAPSTTYAVGDYVANGANHYSCTAAGVSAASGGPTGTGSGIADGSATWAYAATAPDIASVVGVVTQPQGVVAVRSLDVEITNPSGRTTAFCGTGVCQFGRVRFDARVNALADFIRLGAPHCRGVAPGTSHANPDIGGRLAVMTRDVTGYIVNCNDTHLAFNCGFRCDYEIYDTVGATWSNEWPGPALCNAVLSSSQINSIDFRNIRTGTRTCQDPSLYRFRAYLSADAALTLNTAKNPVVFDAAPLNQGSIYDPVAGFGTAPFDCEIELDTGITFKNITTNHTRILAQLIVAGTPYNAVEFGGGLAETSTGQHLMATGGLRSFTLNKGDIFKVAVTVSGTVDTPALSGGQGATWFEGRLVPKTPTGT